MLHKKVWAALLGVGMLTWGTGQALAQDQRVQERFGLRITRVMPGTTADQVGLREGDVIVRVDGNAVRTTADLDRCLVRVGWVAQVDAIEGSSGRPVRVSVYPQGGRIGVTAEPVALVERPAPKQEEKPAAPVPVANPWNPGFQPQFMQPGYPGLNPYLMPPWYPGMGPCPIRPWDMGMYPLPGQPWNHPWFNPWNQGCLTGCMPGISFCP